MSRNDSARREATTTGMPVCRFGRHGITLIVSGIALGLFGWSSLSSGQNATPSVSKERSAVTRGTAGSSDPTNTTKFRSPIRSLQKPSVTQRPPEGVVRDSAVRPASFAEMMQSSALVDSEPTDPGIVGAGSSRNVPLGWPQAFGNATGVPFVSATDRTSSSSIHGSRLGLKPGETATERSVRLMSIIGEMERDGTALAERNADLEKQVKSLSGKLEEAAREMKGAREEVQSLRELVARLQKEVQEVREKSQAAEAENAALLRAVTPLLKQLLDTSDDSAAADHDLDNRRIR